MNSLFLKIAEHTIQLNSENDQLIKPFQKYCVSSLESVTQPDIILTVKGKYGVLFEGFNVDIAKKNHHILFHRADYLIETTKDYREATLSVHDHTAFKHALMNLYSAYIVYHDWGLLLHSSCVVEKGSAHLFAGHSGAGKSTAAKLSSPRSVLSDEASIVKISVHGITVFNSPFRSDTEMNREVASKPVKSIQLLNQSQKNSRELIGKSSSLLKLMDKVFYWKHNATETSMLISLLSRLIERVPVYDLYFQKDDTFWELIS